MTYREVLSQSGFRNLWLGQAISQLGDAFYNVAFLFMVQKVTQNAIITGFVAACEWLPFLLLGPYAGVLADRIDRKRIMLVSDLLSAAVLVVFGAIVLAGHHAPLWSLFVTPFCLSSIRVFFFPAKGAAIPRLVSSESLQAANGLSMSTQSLMPLIGMPLSIAMVAPIYSRSPFAFLMTVIVINLVSYLVSAYFIQKLPEIVPERGEDSHPLQDAKDGFLYVLHHKVLLVVALVSFVMNLFISPFYIVYLATNEAWFGGKPETLATFEFSFFVGMVLGSAVAGKAKISRPAIANSVGLGLVGLTVAAMAYSQSFWPYVLWNVAAGLALPFASIPMQAFIQSTTDDGFRGRVNSALQMVSAGVHPIGMAMAGIMVEQIGLVTSYLIMGFGMLAAALGALLDRSYRRATLAPDPDPSHS